MDCSTRTLVPKPDYWAAVLCRRLMGTTVLESGVPIQQGLHVYAHCQRGTAGGVTLLVINNDRQQTRALTLPGASERYTLDAAQLGDKTVRLNEQPLALREKDALPTLAGVPTGAGEVTFARVTITFLAIPTAANNACR